MWNLTSSDQLWCENAFAIALKKKQPFQDPCMNSDKNWGQLWKRSKYYTKKADFIISCYMAVLRYMLFIKSNQNKVHFEDHSFEPRRWSRPHFISLGQSTTKTLDYFHSLRLRLFTRSYPLINCKFKPLLLLLLPHQTHPRLLQLHLDIVDIPKLNHSCWTPPL